MLSIFLFILATASELQAPRFITPPSSSGSSIVAEGRTKILQCQALGKPIPRLLLLWKVGTFYC